LEGLLSRGKQWRIMAPPYSLSNLGTIGLPSLKRDMAGHLNFGSETSCRTLRRLVEAGLIGLGGNTRVQLLEPDKLPQAAEGPFPQI
jgi:hypothetical protein